MKCHRVKVVLSPISSGKVWIDGQEVPHVKSVTVRGEAGSASAVEIELTAVDIEAEVDPDFDAEVHAP